MPGLIRLATSTGNPIVASGGGVLYIGTLSVRLVELLSPISARAARVVELLSPLASRLARTTELLHPFNAHTRSGYDLYARDLDTNTETHLGFIDAAGTLSLSGVAMPDGHYEIEVRLSGYFWRQHRHLTRFRVSISGGGPAAALPSVANLAASYNLTDTRLLWNWIAATGESTPDDFAIWTSLTEPVNTAGAPAHTVAATAPGDYAADIAQGAAPLHVSVCSRLGASRGAAALLTIPAPPPDAASPAAQTLALP
jgi:hypothetical protein